MRPALMFLFCLCFSPLAFAQQAELLHRAAAKTNEFALPDKPAPATIGEWIASDQPMPEFPADDSLVMVPRKSDGRMFWRVEAKDSCAFCAAPMTFRQAAFDKKALPLWLGRIALFTADIEISHHMPCFKAGLCREGNPLMGQTRGQAYAVSFALTAVDWWATSMLRKGDKNRHIGGMKKWQIFPVLLDAQSAVGIATNLARWNKRQ
jgi:hypothetical protein